MSAFLRWSSGSAPIADAARLGTVLGIWAHPDDEAFLSAGLMAAARDEGNRVVCVTATLGERGTDDPASWPPGRLGAVPLGRRRDVDMGQLLGDEGPAPGAPLRRRRFHAGRRGR